MNKVKNMFYCLSVLIILTILFNSCSTEPNTGISGRYNYTGYNEEGTIIVTGYIDINFQDSTSVTGTWELNAVGNPQGIGPQVGTGTLEGGMENGILYINLNPEWVDNNVFLHGVIDGNIYSGQWIYSGFPGVIAQGTFT